MPFIELPTLHLGPIPIQFFGILVAIGVLVGTSAAVRYATHYKLNEDNMRYVGMRVIIFGFIMCHLLDVFFYTPGKVLKDPWIILKLIEGIASYGGILGASTGCDRSKEQGDSDELAQEGLPECRERITPARSPGGGLRRGPEGGWRRRRRECA